MIRRILSYLIALLMLFSVGGMTAGGEESMALSLYAINVGKADALLLRSGKTAYLIDTGTEDSWPALKKAHGRVLTFGLGLGYFTYHAAENPEVESVTVVDISPDVIALFKEQILPQFPHKEKVLAALCI